MPQCRTPLCGHNKNVLMSTMCHFPNSIWIMGFMASLQAARQHAYLTPYGNWKAMHRIRRKTLSGSAVYQIEIIELLCFYFYNEITLVRFLQIGETIGRSSELPKWLWKDFQDKAGIRFQLITIWLAWYCGRWWNYFTRILGNFSIWFALIDAKTNAIGTTWNNSIVDNHRQMLSLIARTSTTSSFIIHFDR